MKLTSDLKRTYNYIFANVRLYTIDVYEKPATLFVGEFIGTPQMNFIKGTVDKGFFKSKNFNLNIKEDITNENVILGIRPENLILKIMVI